MEDKPGRPTSPSAGAAGAFGPRFRSLAVLGRGGMGIVYRVYDEETATEVALKTLGTNDPDRLYRLKQEFRVLAGITHPNLVELYELIVGADHAFFTMELVEGTTFIEYVQGPPRLERWLAASEQLLAGLAALHGAGRLHRDIKPSNVLVTPAGRVVILDFGLATLLRPEGTADASDAVAGTFAYMAPEQAWGERVTLASDLYSVGVMLYETLAGRLPFEGSPAQMLADKARGAFPPLRGSAAVTERIDTLLAALLQPDPARRPDVEAVLRELRALRPKPTAPSDAATSLRSDGPFVGRTAELDTLRAAFAETQRGKAVTVLVSGPSGIGKSELVRRFLAEVERDAGTWVLRGRCHPEESVPYKAFDALIDALTRRLLAASETEIPAVVPRHASALTRVFPVLARIPAFAARERHEALEPQEVRRRGIAALRDLLARIADRRPLVLWIDDVQWADLDSGTVLRELRREPDPPPLLLFLSYRDEESTTLLDALLQPSEERAQRVERIALGPLSGNDTRVLASLLCPASPDRELRIAEIASEAAGSPFFVVELTRHVTAGLARRGEGVTVSGRLLDAINGRVQRLSAVARTLLAIASIAGEPLDRSLALHAAGIGERGRPLVTMLTHACLLRPTIVRDRAGFEVYHDRIAEAVTASLSEEELRSRHAALAEALLAQPGTDPEALFRHCLGAGRRTEAADWAVSAADRAAGALAFARAAELYRAALDLKPWGDEQATRLQTQLANALVNTGRAAEAAPLYVAASTKSAGVERLDLRRRAAEQYLVSGHIDHGVAELRSLFTELGLSYPSSPGRAALALVGRLAQLWARGTAFVSRPESAVSGIDLLRVDASDSAAKGLLQVDPIRGTYFSALALLLALRAGEPRRIGLNLSLGASGLVVGGAPMARWGMQMLDHARRMAAETRDPYVIGVSAIGSAFERIAHGSWDEVLRLCDEGERVLRDQCRGVTWERDIGRMAALRALEEIGDVPEVLRRANALAREAEEVGDLYAELTARQYAAFWRLAADDVAGARAEARAALALWTHSGYHLQHFYALRIESYCDVYEGAPKRAWERVAAGWPALRRSNLLWNPLVRLDAHLLRARVALATARGAAQARQLRCAARDARRLAREKRPDARAHAALVEAGVAALRGDRTRAAARLAAAADGFDSAGATLHAAYARHRHGELLDGEGGRALMREADAVIARATIRNPARWLAVHAPGLG